jgi:hypothetical protein
LSGIDNATCPTDSLITTEGLNQSLSRTVFDLAGNAKTAASSPVKIDLTAPVTTASAVPSGFTNTDVSVTLTATDNLSGVAQTVYSVNGGPQVVGNSVTFTSDGVHTLTYYSVDNAGNTEALHTVTIRIDREAPTIDSAQSPLANGAGWNNTNVTVTFTCADALSGIASCTAPQTVSTDGAAQAVSGTAIDNAGNSASTTRSVSVDKTPPTITGVRSVAPNANGWNNVAVGVTFTCADGLSGLASCSAPSTVGEGAGQSRTGTATDVAGNSASTTVSPINVDLTAPTITATPSRPPDSGGVYTSPVTVTFTCTDALSGIAPGACPAPVTVSVDGTTTVTGTTTDRAGNTATTSASVTLTVATVLSQKSNILIAITQAHLTATQHDKSELKVARDSVAHSVDPKWWTGFAGADGNHIAVNGTQVFVKEREAVMKLTTLLNDPATAVPDATLLGWITALTNADRTLASIARSDAIAQGGDATKISESGALLAAGDAKRSAGDNSGAIEDYKNAWMKALQAVGKNPT